MKQLLGPFRTLNCHASSFGRLLPGLLALALAGCASSKSHAKPEAEKIHQRGWIGGEYMLAHRIWLFGTRDPYLAAMPPGMTRSNRFGVVITGLSSNAPVRLAGLREGDLIIACGHQPVRTMKDFRWRVDHAEPGSVLRFTAWRAGQTFDCDVAVGRETFKNWGTIALGLGLPNLSDFGHFDLWPNPGFDLGAVGFEAPPNDRKERDSGEEAYYRACHGSKHNPTEQVWNAWVAILRVSHTREILSQETVAANGASVGSAFSPQGQ